MSHSHTHTLNRKKEKYPRICQRKRSNLPRWFPCLMNFQFNRVSLDYTYTQNTRIVTSAHRSLQHPQNITCILVRSSKATVKKTRSRNVKTVLAVLGSNHATTTTMSFHRQSTITINTTRFYPYINSPEIQTIIQIFELFNSPEVPTFPWSVFLHSVQSLPCDPVGFSVTKHLS